jgi:hypothetical protein
MSDRRDDLPWEIYDPSLPFAGALYGPQRARLGVIGMGGGELLIISPGAPISDARWRTLEAWGTPRFLLAPNHFHNLGLTAWQQRYPDAQIVAHPRALTRLRRRLPALEIHDLSPLEAALPPAIRLFSPPMATQGETWVAVQIAAGAAWFVTDGLVNLRSLPPGPTGLFFWLMGFRPRLMVNPFFKRLFLRDKAAFKAWALAELERDSPALVVPAHGGLIDGPDHLDALRAALEAA